MRTRSFDMEFPDRIREMMLRSGKSFQECCRIFGRAGGKAAATRKRRIAVERQKQEAIGIR